MKFLLFQGNHQWNGFELREVGEPSPLNPQFEGCPVKVPDISDPMYRCRDVRSARRK